MPINSASNQVTKILKIQIDSENAIETLKQLDEILSDVKKQEQQLTKEINENGKTHKFSAQEIETKKKELQALKQAEKDYKTMVNEVSKVVQNELKADREKMGSIKQLRAQLSNLTKAYDDLARVDREGLKGKQLLKDIQNLTKEIKDAEYATMRYQRNVGNYGSALAGLRERYAGVADGIARTSSAIRTGFLGIAAGVALAARAIRGIASEYKTIINFQQANANLSTILGVNITQMNQLRESALELGRTTEYTASQVTSLQTELAKLGFTQEQIMNMQKYVLQFATAVGTDLASAASLAGATLRAFELDSTQTEDVLATMAVATNKSALSFSILQTAMSTIAPVAHAYGLSLKDTTALLGTLANAGFDASSAATATRNILLNLADTNGKLAKTLGSSVKTFDDIMNALIKLRDSGVDLNTTLELTDKRSVAAFNSFLSGAEASKELRDELENVNGELERIQSERLDTVEGSIKLMQSAWEGFILSMSNSTGTIKYVIDMLTEGIEGATLAFRNARVGEYANNQVGILQDVFDRFGSEYLDQYIKNREAEYDKLIEKAGRKRRKQLQEEKEALRVALEKVDQNLDHLSFQERLQQIQRAYETKVAQFQANMSLSQREADQLSEQARLDYEEQRKAIIKAEKQRIDAANAERLAAEEKKNAAILAEDEKARQKREREQKRYNDLVFREAQKAEDALINLIKDASEKRLAQENRNYEKTKATIQKAMQEEAKAHGTKTQLYQIYLDQLETLEKQHQLNLKKIEEATSLEELKRTVDIYQKKIDLARKNSSEQFELRRNLLATQMQQELANTELTEEQKQLIRQKYAQSEAQLRDEEVKAAADQVANVWQARIMEAQIANDEYGQIELEMLKERLENLQQYELESDEDFYLRKLEAQRAYNDKKKQLADAEIKIEQTKANYLAGIAGSISDLMESVAGENQEMVKASKYLALAEVAIKQGVAISEAVASAAAGDPYTYALRVASAIASTIAAMAQAITSINSVKLARGTSYVKGPGTSTSDSIPAMLSLGEGVVNAKGNALFPGLVQAINDIGNGIAVPVQNQTSYTYTNVANAAGGITPEQIAEAMSQMPPSEVAVSEIDRVSDRINVIENLRNN